MVNDSKCSITRPKAQTMNDKEANGYNAYVVVALVSVVVLAIGLVIWKLIKISKSPPGPGNNSVAIDSNIDIRLGKASCEFKNL